MLSVGGPDQPLPRSARTRPGGLDLSTRHVAAGGRRGHRAASPGIAYALVAIPSQTQLQEDLPEDVRGRVFGILNMLVSVSSFLPIIIVGPISDLIGTTRVLVAVARSCSSSGIASVVVRGPLLPSEAHNAADPNAVDPIAAALGADRPTWHERDGARADAAPAIAGPDARRRRRRREQRRRAGPSDPADRA